MLPKVYRTLLTASKAAALALLCACGGEPTAPVTTSQPEPGPVTVRIDSLRAGATLSELTVLARSVGGAGSVRLVTYDQPGFSVSQPPALWTPRIACQSAAVAVPAFAPVSPTFTCPPYNPATPPLWVTLEVLRGTTWERTACVALLPTAPVVAVCAAELRPAR